MISWLNHNISLETLVWLFPVTFMLHDFEEIIFVELWFKKNYRKVIQKVPKYMQNTFQELSSTTAARFTIPVFLQFIMYVIASLLAAEQQYYGAFVGFNFILFLHVFMHIGQSIFLRVYALGVGSALVITLPYSLYIFYRLIVENKMDLQYLLFNLPYGFLTVFVLLLGHKMARRILP